MSRVGASSGSTDVVTAEPLAPAPERATAPPSLAGAGARVEATSAPGPSAATGALAMPMAPSVASEAAAPEPRTRPPEATGGMPPGALDEGKLATRLRLASPSREGDRVDARLEPRPPSTALREEEEFPSCPVSTKEAAAPACPLPRRPAAEPPVGAVMRGALGPDLRDFLEEWRPLPLRLPPIALVGNPPRHQDLIAPLLARTQGVRRACSRPQDHQGGKGSRTQLGDGPRQPPLDLQPLRRDGYVRARATRRNKTPARARRRLFAEMDGPRAPGHARGTRQRRAPNEHGRKRHNGDRPARRTLAVKKRRHAAEEGEPGASGDADRTRPRCAPGKPNRRDERGGGAGGGVEGKRRREADQKRPRRKTATQVRLNVLNQKTTTGEAPAGAAKRKRKENARRQPRERSHGEPETAA